MLKADYNLRSHRRSRSLDDELQDTKTQEHIDSKCQYAKGSIMEKYGLDPLVEDYMGMNNPFKDQKKRKRPMLSIKPVALTRVQGDGLRSAMALTFDRSGEVFNYHSPVNRRRYSTQYTCTSPLSNSQNKRLSIQEQLSSLAIHCASPGLPLNGMSNQMNAMIQQSRDIELQQQRLIGKKRQCQRSSMSNESVSSTTSSEYAIIETVYPLTPSNHSPKSWSPNNNKNTDNV